MSHPAVQAYGARMSTGPPAMFEVVHNFSIGFQYAGQELNLQSSKAGGLQPLGLANTQPTPAFVVKWHRWESNPQTPRSELGRFANLRTVPNMFSSALDGI